MEALVANSLPKIEATHEINVFISQMKCKWLRRVTGSLTEMSCTAQNKWKCLLLKWLSVGSVKRAVQSNNPKDKDCGQSYYPSMTYKYAGFKILTENQGDSYFTKFEISIFACSLVHWFSNCFRFCCMTFPSNVDTIGHRRLESHDWRSCKKFSSCVNFTSRQPIPLQNLC